MGAAVYGVLVAAQGFGAWAILAAMIVAVPVYAIAWQASAALPKKTWRTFLLSAQSAGSGQAFWLF